MPKLVIESVPHEDTSLTSAQAVASVAKANVLHKTSPTSHLKAWQQSLPAPSHERQQASLQEAPLDLSQSTPEPQIPSKQDGKPQTILYLAYGSNLSAETFLGKRGIRPLAQVNVAVPELVMTFDLPGLPYTEPCFANTAYRSSRPSNPSLSSEESPLLPPVHTQNGDYRNPSWPKPMVGVVYEVTPSDFAHILATEGGGAAYQDVLVDCHALPADITTVPSTPATPAFKAHTLYSPITPHGKSPQKKGNHFSRPDPEYAQPSARYLKLIRDGAEEHSLPSEYMTYLEELQPYTITTRRQALGKMVFMVTWLPIISAVFKLARMFHDKSGRSPEWLQRFTGVMFRGVWISYDGVFKRVFGDGERTQEGGGGKQDSWNGEKETGASDWKEGSAV